MARTARFEMRIAPNLLDRIDAVRGDAPRTAYVERAVRMRLANDESGGSEQTVSVPVDRVVRPESSVLPSSAPSSGPSAAASSGVVPGSVPSEAEGDRWNEQAGPIPVDPGRSVRPAAPDSESHDEPEYERRPPPRMTGGRRAR